MARQYVVEGETLIQVKGNSNSSIASLSTLGVTDSPIVITVYANIDDVLTDPTGKLTPIDGQIMGGYATVQLSLIHFDRAFLDAMYTATIGGTAPGTMGRAGQFLGGGTARFASGWNFFGMNLTAPIAGSGWNFKACQIGNSYNWPIGTERSAVGVTIKAIPYVADPASGLALAVLFNNTLDT